MNRSAHMEPGAVRTEEADLPPPSPPFSLHIYPTHTYSYTRAHGNRVAAH
eukprot:COSAG06_NODE_64632_length_259_cov_0.631250_1_plen_49_part_10